MKFVVAALVFILALSITPKVLAENNAEHKEVVCTADQKENCVEAKAEHKSEKAGHGSQEDHHEKLGKTMNSLFPQKQKDASHSTRPTVVKLTSPKFLAKIAGNSTKLEWTAAEGATAYHVQVATDPNFKWLVANEYWVKGTSFEAERAARLAKARDELYRLENMLSVEEFNKQQEQKKNEEIAATKAQRKKEVEELFIKSLHEPAPPNIYMTFNGPVNPADAERIALTVSNKVKESRTKDPSSIKRTKGR